VDSGGVLQLSSGDMSVPSHVNSAGILCPFSKAGLVSFHVIADSSLNPDFSQRNPENRDKANPIASQRRFGIGHIRNSMLPHHSLAVPCIISLISIFNLHR